ncbi:ankyrin repeat domain-containing protein [Glaciimonas sp. GG7]
MIITVNDITNSNQTSPISSSPESPLPERLLVTHASNQNLPTSSSDATSSGDELTRESFLVNFVAGQKEEDSKTTINMLPAEIHANIVKRFSNLSDLTKLATFSQVYSDEAAFCFRQFDKKTQITELHKAIGLDDESQALQALNFCIKSGVEADVLNAIKNQSTPLRLAVKKGHTKVIKVLVGLPEVDINLTEPLSEAIGHKKLNIANFLLDQPTIRPDSTDDMSDLALAAAIEDMQLVNRFIARPDYVPHLEPLLAVARRGCIPIGQTILAADVHCNAINGLGFTALGLSAHNGHIAFVKMLQKIPDIDMNAGEPFLNAATENKLEMCQLLIDDGRCDVNRIDTDGNAALNKALNKAFDNNSMDGTNNLKIIDMLVKHQGTDLTLAVSSLVKLAEECVETAEQRIERFNSFAPPWLKNGKALIAAGNEQLLLVGELASAANDPTRAADKASLHRDAWAKAIEKHLELKKLLIAFKKWSSE